MHRHARAFSPSRFVASACSGAASPTPAPTGAPPASTVPASAAPASAAPTAVLEPRQGRCRARHRRDGQGERRCSASTPLLALLRQIGGAGTSANLVYSPAKHAAGPGDDPTRRKATTASQMTRFSTAWRPTRPSRRDQRLTASSTCATDVRHRLRRCGVTLRLPTRRSDQQGFAFQPAYLDALAVLLWSRPASRRLQGGPRRRARKTI